MLRETGHRAGLTRERVLAAAGGIASEGGLDKLTIRSLARTLDVAPNAVYGWVENKETLLDALVDDALAGVVENWATTDRKTNPAVQLRALLLETFDAMMSRPELAPLFLDRAASPGPNATRIRVLVAELLSANEAEKDRAAAAVPVLLVHVMGFASFVQQTHGAKLLEGPTLGTPRDLFATGLDWLLGGISDPDNK
jgi:TetR/AcrR family tetracycline transcriptional repressor